MRRCLDYVSIVMPDVSQMTADIPGYRPSKTAPRFTLCETLLSVVSMLFPSPGTASPTNECGRLLLLSAESALPLGTLNFDEDCELIGVKDAYIFFAWRKRPHE
jgi:hypothetical protein